MFRDALDYSTRPPRGGRAVLVGGTLVLVAEVLAAISTLDTLLTPAALVALAPWLLVRGYYVRVLRTTAGHEYPTPPAFDDVFGLLRDGVAAALIGLAYLLPGVAVLAPFVYVRAQGSDLVTLVLGGRVPEAVAAGVAASAGVVALFALFAVFGGLYVLPVAVTRFAHTGRLRAALDVRTVVSGAATEDYVVAWAVSLLLQLLVLPVAYALKVVLLGFYLHFLVAVGVRYCYGQGVGVALGLDPVDSFLDEPAGGTGAGDLRTAVRPIEESDEPALRASGGTEETDPTEVEDDPFEYPARERGEGERT